MEEICFAAIDIGSNAVRLLIQGIYPGETARDLRKIYLTRVPLRLGQEVFTESFISPQKADRLERLMRAFRELMGVYGVVAWRACATSAMRDARNGEDIVRSIRSKSGIDIEIIDGKKEAELICNDRLCQLFALGKEYLFVDVGGGSTEISRVKNGSPDYSESFDIGTVRQLNGKVDPTERERMRLMLETIRNESGELELVGSGGNINRLFHLAGIDIGHPLPVECLQKVYELLRSLSIEERIRTLRLKPDRADVIEPAAELFLDIAYQSGAKRIWVPATGIADGINYRLCEAYLGSKNN